MKAPASGEAKFQGRERLIARVAKLVFRFQQNPRLGIRHEMNPDFLFFNGVSGAKSGDATRRAESRNGKKREKKKAWMRGCLQNVSIVARERNRSKRQQSHSGAQIGPARWGCGTSTRPAAVNANEACLIPCVLAGDDFFLGLRVGHARIDALENLLFRQPGVFETSDLRAIERPQPLHAPVKNGLHGGVGESHELQCDRVGAEVIELVSARNGENFNLVETGLGETGGGIPTRERMLMRMSGAKESDTGFIADAGLLELYELRHFLIGSVHPLELLDVAEIHPGLIERAIVRQKVLLAPARKKGAHPEKQQMRMAAHNFIVAGANGLSTRCALGDTRQKDR